MEPATPATFTLDADELEFLQALVGDPTDDKHTECGVERLPPPLAQHDGSLTPASSTPDAQDEHRDVLDDDVALVLSALELFPLSDDENGDASTSRTDTTNSATVKTLKTTRRRSRRPRDYDSNRARNLRRHELVYLRNKVNAMETELARLRITSGAQLTTTTTALARPLHPLQRPPRVAVWERIAARQLNERKRAERENERLKIVLETQLKIAKSLEQLLHRRTTMQGFGECGLDRQSRVFACAPSASDADAFQSLLDQVHACYLDADTHFDNFGIGASDDSCRDARIRHGGSGVDVAREAVGRFRAEIFANDVLPFPVHAAGQAAWRYFSHYKNHQPYRLYYERVNEIVGIPEDTILEKSVLELHVNNTKAVFNFKQVIRRYVERDRVVIAYSTIAQPVEFASKPVGGLEFREWGCMVLKKPTTLDADSYSVLKSCFFITPSFRDADGDNRDAITGELVDFVLSSTAATMGAWLQMIENILVVEHAGKAPTPPIH